MTDSGSYFPAALLLNPMNRQIVDWSGRYIAQPQREVVVVGRIVDDLDSGWKLGSVDHDIRLGQRPVDVPGTFHHALLLDGQVVTLIQRAPTPRGVAERQGESVGS